MTCKHYFTTRWKEGIIKTFLKVVTISLKPKYKIFCEKFSSKIIVTDRHGWEREGTN